MGNSIGNLDYTCEIQADDEQGEKLLAMSVELACALVEA